MTRKMKLITGAAMIAMELAAIKAETKNLSGYTTTDAGYTETGAGYDGTDEASAVGKQAAARYEKLDFKFNITNTGSSAVTRTLAWYAPEGMTVAKLSTRGYTVDAVVTDGTIIATANATVVVTASRSTLPYDELLRICRINGHRLCGMTIASTNTNAFLIDLQVYQLGLRKSNEKIIDISDYFSDKNLVGKKIDIDLVNDGLDLSFDDQTLMIGQIIAGVDMTWTYKFGSVNNIAAKVDKIQRHDRNNMAIKATALGSSRKG